ncbi:hypothetical protein GL4_2839 [Methyloceanibacter caenitepidi]|uniref:Uncharacterized protein n=1 Tax=Methyloceanibacter caenitepidi TaxID=1384459 RepID=A0A0A8K6Y2_9HYPH|nr:hypothetical protein GL4_2839 [Methyloceanibacter caenitepidi]
MRPRLLARPRAMPIANRASMQTRKENWVTAPQVRQVSTHRGVNSGVRIVIQNDASRV